MKKEINYYYDCEFLEGTQQKRFLGIPFGKTLNTIDLISIGVVSEDGRELYLISKEFNLKEAWSRCDNKVEIMYGDMRNVFPEGRRYKEYWIRENVLKPIFHHFIDFEYTARNRQERILGYSSPVNTDFTYINFKRLLKKYGLDRKSIRWELTKFILDPNDDVWGDWLSCSNSYWTAITDQHFTKANLYGYYSAYDHVCLAWIYGKMIDLPSGMPMYTKDLKQILDENLTRSTPGNNPIAFSFKNNIKLHKDYPTQDNLHDALDDAKWNKKLHEFINSLGKAL